MDPQKKARAAGLLYLATIAAGVFAEAFVRGRLVVRGDAAATAANLLAHETLYRAGLVADLAMLACYLGVTVLLFELFAPADRSRSRLAACFSLTGIAVLAAGTVALTAPLVLLKPSPELAAVPPAQLQALARAALRLHGQAYLVADAFFGAYCILLGTLCRRSGLLPKALGTFLALGGVAYLADSLSAFLAPALPLPPLALVGALGELAFSLALVRGLSGASRPDHP